VLGGIADAGQTAPATKAATEKAETIS
jgi:hypothetical protein